MLNSQLTKRLPHYHKPRGNSRVKSVAALLPLWLACWATANPTYPLKVASGTHYIIDQNNQPFFVQGDSPWYLIQRLNAADVDYYLSNRWAQGYNSIILDLQSHQFGSGGGIYPQADAYGHLPFTSTIAGGAYTNLLSVNPLYYTNADYVIQRAGYYGMNVFLYPLYDGYGGGAQGWYADMAGNGTSALYQFGQFVGNRYKSFPNIVYVGAGDYNEPNSPNYLWNAVANGILSADPNHLMTAHPARTYSALSYYSNSWDTLNSSYPTSLTYLYSLANYQRIPVIPSFMRESYYEGTVSALTCRQQAWGAVLSGDAGHCYGNGSLWQFNAGWQTLLQSAGATTLTNVLRLMNTRPWYNCIPDANHLAVVSGYGTWGNTDYTSVMRETAGKTVIAYIPQDSMTPTVDLTKISGTTANAWWYDPRQGVATWIGSYSTIGTRTFAPPDANDWVLVLDDASQNLGAPGSPPSAAPSATSFQSWEAQYLSAVDLADPTKESSVWGYLADPDRDGRNNLMDYALGLSPRGGNNNNTGIRATVSAASGGRFQFLTFNQRTTDASLAYIPQVSADKQHWNSDSASVTLVASSSSGVGFQTVTCQDLTPVAPGQRRFVQLVVSRIENSLPVATSTSEVYVASAVVFQGTAGGRAQLNYFAPSVVHPVVAGGLITGVGINSLTDGTPYWTDSQLSSTSGNFYVEFASGLRADIVGTVVATGTLNLASDLQGQVNVGDTYQIRKHLTLAEVLGSNNEAGLLGGNSPAGADDVVLLNARSQSLELYFYCNVPGYTGWYRGDFQPAGNAVVYPEQALVVNRKAAGTTTCYLDGVSKSGRTVVPVWPGLNLVGTLTSAQSFTLAQLNLYTGNPATGIAGGSNPAAADDLVIPTGSGLALYFYCNIPGYIGWYNGGFNRADTVVIPPQAAFYIKRKAPNAGFNWIVPAE